MRFTIKSKLAVAFGAVILLTAALAVVATSRFSQFNDALHHIVDVSAEKTRLAIAMEAEFFALTAAQSEIFLAEDAEEAAHARAEIDEHFKALKAFHDSFLAVAEADHQSADIEAVERLDTAFAPYTAIEERVAELVNKSLVLKSSGSILSSDAAMAEAIEIIKTEGAEVLGASKKILLEIVDRNQRFMEDEKAATNTLYARSRTFVVGVAAVSILIGLIAAIWMALSLSRGVQRAAVIAGKVAAGDPSVDCTPRSNDEIADLLVAMGGMNDALSQMSRATDRMAQGDLTANISARSDQDQLGLSLNRMLTKLRDVLSGAMQNAESVDKGAQIVNDAADQLSVGSVQQASAAEEASAAMEEMSANIRQSADNAAQTEKIAQQASEGASESGQAVSEAVSAMKTIASKITIIQEIARQTDLLALNAAVEAARAGSHGKGFAVVASEVRKLAERSQQAAAEIGTLSGKTLEVSEKAGDKLETLLPLIQRTSDLVAEISAATREQNIGAEQINQSIRELDKVVQQNATLASETASISGTLTNQSGQLRTMIAYYRLDANRATEVPMTEPKPKSAAKPKPRTQPKAAPAARPAPGQGGAASAQQPHRPQGQGGKAGPGGFDLDLWSDEIPDSEFEPIRDAS